MPNGNGKTRQVWLCVCDHRIQTHLMSGTGNACAWQSRANELCKWRTYVIDLASLENAGALLPTGSERVV